MARKKSGMVIHDVEQRSLEWHELRAKYPLTASNAQAIANNGKGLETLIFELLSRRHSAAPEESYVDANMERGMELEEQARSLYELETGFTVRTVGFVTNEAVSGVGGASPDGLVDTHGLLEIKCPEDKKYFRMLILGIEVDPAYEWQMQMQMLFTERAWCDLAIYNPNFTQPFLVKRLEADKKMHKALREGLAKGEALIKEIESKLTNLS